MLPRLRKSRGQGAAAGNDDKALQRMSQVKHDLRRDGGDQLCGRQTPATRFPPNEPTIPTYFNGHKSDLRLSGRDSLARQRFPTVSNNSTLMVGQWAGWRGGWERK